jgi:hypothetical protein
MGFLFHPCPSVETPQSAGTELGRLTILGAMAEPVRKRMEPELLDEEPGITLQRWVEGPGGRMELVEMPLTPELFLNPQVGDHMTQGTRHGDTAREIADVLDHFFGPVPDVLVTFDLKHLFGPGLSQPSPDVSVIRGRCATKRLTGRASTSSPRASVPA